MWELPDRTKQNTVEQEQLPDRPLSNEDLDSVLRNTDLCEDYVCKSDEACDLAIRCVQLMEQLDTSEKGRVALRRQLSASVQQLRTLYKELNSCIESSNIMLSWRVIGELVKQGVKQGFIEKPTAQQEWRVPK